MEGGASLNRPMPRVSPSCSSSFHEGLLKADYGLLCPSQGTASVRRLGIDPTYVHAPAFAESTLLPAASEPEARDLQGAVLGNGFTGQTKPCISHETASQRLRPEGYSGALGRLDHESFMRTCAVGALMLYTQACTYTICVYICIYPHIRVYVVTHFSCSSNYSVRKKNRDKQRHVWRVCICVYGIYMYVYMYIYRCVCEVIAY